MRSIFDKEVKPTISSYLAWTFLNNKLRSASSFLITVANAAINLAAPFFLVRSLGSLQEDDVAEGVKWMFAYALSWSSAKSLAIGRELLLLPVGTNLSHKLTLDVMKKSYSLPMEYRISNTNAPAVQHFGASYEHIGRTFIDRMLGRVLPSVVEAIMAFGLVGYVFGDMSLVLAGLLVSYAGVTLLGSKKVTAVQVEYIYQLFNSYDYIISQLDQYENVHYFGNVGYELKNIQRNLGNLDEKINQSLSIRNKAMMFQSALMGGLAILGASLFFDYDVFNDGYSGEDFSWIIFYLLQLLANLETLSENTNKLFSDYESFKMLITYLDQDGDQEDMQLPELKLTSQAPSIEFKNVSLTYDEKQGPVLKNISFSIAEGKTAVIAGLSGAGKSSILKLLENFYKPTEGSVTIDGNNIEEFNTSSLRAYLAVVPQLPRMLPDATLYENIRYGNLEVEDRERVKKAAEDAGLRKFISERGLDAPLGQGGAKSSGGQRQRIAIARAYLRDSAKILVLDEPTSALDSKTEIAVMKKLNRLIQIRKLTTLLITHKLTNIKYINNVDKIIVLDEGRIVEEGSFATLMQANGLFAKQYGLAGEREEFHSRFKSESKTTGNKNTNFENKNDLASKRYVRSNSWDLTMTRRPRSTPPSSRRFEASGIRTPLLINNGVQS